MRYIGAKERLAIQVAANLSNYLVDHYLVDKDQGQFLFSIMADALMDLPEDELTTYLPLEERAPE